MRKKVIIASFVLLVISVTVWWLCAPGNRQPLPSILFSHYETNDDSRCGVLLMTNSGSGAACYNGYSGDSPLYSMMSHSPTGWVSDAEGWWCAMGVQPCILAAGSSVTFRVYYFRTNQNWKVGISYYAPTVYDRIPPFVGRYFNSSRPKSQMVWSEGIEYDSKR